MKFTIDVGEVERQRVEFNFNQLLGRTLICSNGRELKRSIRLFSEPTTETHVIQFNEAERIELRIEKRRKMLFASRYYVYVNNRLTQVYEGV